uniref:Uncharacterized protein n=1 Tax=Rhizophora mucronata TaxID=61149 RepID=A0A2P2PT11_RHIMU
MQKPLYMIVTHMLTDAYKIKCISEFGNDSIYAREVVAPEIDGQSKFVMGILHLETLMTNKSICINLSCHVI